LAQFTEKVVIITGGGSGIGRATAIAFAKAGAKVAIANRREDSGWETLRLVKDAGGDGIFVKTDVTSESDVQTLINTTVNTYGRLDFAFNNAGIEQKPVPLMEQTEAEFEQVINTNVKGVWLCMKYQIPAMLKNGSGALAEPLCKSIVNTSSFAGVNGFATIPIYSASKHAVLGLTKSVALEFAKQGIRVNAICPGAVGETGTFERSFGGNEQAIAYAKTIHPIGRIGIPAEIASTVMYLCSEGAGFITGQSFTMDGGWSAGFAP
jgi:NAD(P)-dependent dehydrogenase (short-subunit alcohol dehydrogenase family)